MTKKKPEPNPKTAWPFPTWKDGKIVKPRKPKFDTRQFEEAPF